MLDDIPCPSCKGEGVDFYEQWKVCSQCGGKGKIVGRISDEEPQPKAKPKRPIRARDRLYRRR